MSDVIKSSFSDGVLHVVINRPEKKNALDPAAFKGLTRALGDASDNDRVNVVLLSGAGGNFCSGMDLSATFDEGGVSYEDCARAVIEFDKPMVCAVNGIAIGGGATIPLHCDVVYVSPSLKMRFPFVNLGLVPEFASSYMLQANIGARRAAELMYTARWIDADLALSSGIATGVIEEDELLATAMATAREIAQWPVAALKGTKACLMQAHHQAIQDALVIEKKLMNQQAGSPENIEAITAFIEKRKPDFRKLLNKD